MTATAKLLLLVGLAALVAAFAWGLGTYFASATYQGRHPSVRDVGQGDVEMERFRDEQRRVTCYRSAFGGRTVAWSCVADAPACAPSDGGPK